MQDSHQEDLELLQQLEANTKKPEVKQPEVKPVAKKQSQQAEVAKPEIFLPQRSSEPHIRKPNRKGFTIQFKPDQVLENIIYFKHDAPPNS